MKKLLLFSLFALIASFVGRAELKTYTEDFSTNPLGLAVSGKDNGTKTSTVTKFEYTLNGATSCYFFEKGPALFIGKKNSSITLPKFSGKVTKIEVTSSKSTGGATVTLNDVSTGSVIATNSFKNGNNDPRTYEISKKYQVANEELKLVITSSHNFHLAKLVFYVEEDGGSTPDPEPGTVAAPTIRPADGSKVEYGSQVTVTSAEGTTLLVTLQDLTNGESKKVKIGDYDSETNVSTFTLPTDESIKTVVVEASAVNGDDMSELATATYTFINNKVKNIQEFLDAKDTSESKVFQTDATVIYQNADKKDLFLTDGSGYLYVYGNPGLTGLKNGDVIKAGYEGLYTDYSGCIELTNPTNFVKSETAGTPVEALDATVKDLVDGNFDCGTYVSLAKVKYSGGDLYDLADESKSIDTYNKYSLVSFEEGKVYNVEAIYSIYNNKKQLLPLKADELQYVATPTITPAFGDIYLGTEITIDCATEGAEYILAIDGEYVDDVTMPYTFTANKVGTIKVELLASKAGYEDSELNGEFNVTKQKITIPTVTPAFGEIEVGTEVTIDCEMKDAKLFGKINGEYLEATGVQFPYTFTAEAEGELAVKIWASYGEKYQDSDILEGTYTVVPAQVVAYKDVIAYSDDEFESWESGYTVFEGIVRSGAVYTVGTLLAKNNGYLQFNSKKDEGKEVGVVMTKSPASVSTVIINWAKSGKGDFNIYGKNTPYEGTADLYGSNTGELITTVAYNADGASTITLDKKFTYIGVKATGAAYIESIQFIWNEGAAGGEDVAYTKTAEDVVAGNFAVLATEAGKAVGRGEAANGVIAAADVTVENNEIAIKKGQVTVDEFEIIANGESYNLKGGLESDNSRRFLSFDANGLATVAEADANAAVTFEQQGAGLVVKFKDGQYLVYNGTAFVKGDLVATQAEGDEVTPVYVFMSASNVSTGVDSIDADEAGVAEYYNLNGVKVNVENLTPGLYIVRQGSKVSKQVIR